MTDRLISLTVRAGDDIKHEVFQKVNEIAFDLNTAHDFEYITVSSTKYDDSDVDTSADNDDLYHDENTVKNVYVAIKHALPSYVEDAHEVANDVLLSLQNAGILFRERHQ